MTQYFNNIFAAILLSSWSSAATIAADGKVEVEVTGLKSNKGQVTIKVYQSADGFPRDDDKAYKIQSFEINDMQLKVTIELLPGEYAIVVSHDENANGKVDTNFIGLPKEPLGVSNYPKIAKPNYEKAKFMIGQNDTVKLSIPVDTIL